MMACRFTKRLKRPGHASLTRKGSGEIIMVVDLASGSIPETRYKVVVSRFLREGQSCNDSDDQGAVD